MSIPKEDERTPENDILRTVAKAICKSRTCTGFNCCQYPANMGVRHSCPVDKGLYDDAARDALQACSFTSLREALAPFAAAHERFEAGLDDCIAEYFDNSEICDGVTWGDLRRARAALNGVTQPASDEPDEFDLEPGELRPCPFCGGEAERIDFEDEDDEPENIGGSAITCKRCQCSTAVVFGYKETLFSSWNERVTAKSQPSTEVEKISTDEVTNGT